MIRCIAILLAAGASLIGCASDSNLNKTGEEQEPPPEYNALGFDTYSPCATLLDVTMDATEDSTTAITITGLFDVKCGGITPDFAYWFFSEDFLGEMTITSVIGERVLSNGETIEFESGIQVVGTMPVAPFEGFTFAIVPIAPTEEGEVAVAIAEVGAACTDNQVCAPSIIEPQ